MKVIVRQNRVFSRSLSRDRPKSTLVLSPYVFPGATRKFELVLGPTFPTSVAVASTKRSSLVSLRTAATG